MSRGCASSRSASILHSQTLDGSFSVVNLEEYLDVLLIVHRLLFFPPPSSLSSLENIAPDELEHLVDEAHGSGAQDNQQPLVEVERHDGEDGSERGNVHDDKV